LLKTIQETLDATYTVIQVGIINFPDGLQHSCLC